MAFYHHYEEMPERRRRRKTARERRDQRARAVARAFQTVATVLQDVDGHRGGNLKKIGVRWHGHLFSPDASEVPMPNFRSIHIAADAAADMSWRACRKTALQSTRNDDASQVSGDSSIVESQPLQGDEGEESASQVSDDMRRACRKTALQSNHSDDDSSIIELQSLQGEEGEESADAGSETSDSADEKEAERMAVEEFPEMQSYYRRLYRPDATRPGEGVGSNDASNSSCGHSIGDIIRPIYRLADLQAYRCGAICQVVEVDFEGDPIVSYFEPCGKLETGQQLHYAEHFEKICTAEFLEAHQNGIPHSTWDSVLNANKQCTQEMLFSCFARY